MTADVKNGSAEMSLQTKDNVRIGGSVVECSPATRAARVRFPADAKYFTNDNISIAISVPNFWDSVIFAY